MNPTVKAGQVWQHYKGGVYKIVTLAQNNQTEELHDAVVYQDVTAPEKVWTQSLARFSSSEQYEGKAVPRFTFVSDN